METRVITITRFKIATVFDVSQTEGRDLPTIGATRLNGTVENFQYFYDKLVSLSPVAVAVDQVPRQANGYYSHVEQRIVLRPGLSEIQTIKTLVHEISHAMLHNPDQIPSEERKDRHEKEVEAESIAYVVCQHFGIDTSEYSFGYVAGWSSERFLAECYISLGDAYSNYFLGDEDPRKALEYTTKAIKLMEAGVENGEFDTSEVAKTYHKLAYKYHFAGGNESFVYWMEKCVRTSLQCWDSNHPRINSGYKCLAEAYRYLLAHYKERVLRKKYLEHKLANGGFPFEHQQIEYQSILS